MLRDIARRGDYLGLADIVVCEEDDLKQVADIRVVVHDIANLVDEMDDSLRHPVPWRCLATKDRHPRSELLPLLGRHGLDLQVSVDDTEDVELLTLVLVDTLHLHIEQSCRVDGDAVVLLDVLRQSYLVRIFDLTELLSEFLVVNKSLELAKQREIFEEFVTAKFRSDQRRQSRVRLVQPSSRCDTIGNICELVRSVDLHKVLENCRLDEIGVEFGHTVHLVRANQSKVGHANHLRIRLLDDRDTPEHIAILREVTLNILQEVKVDVLF